MARPGGAALRRSPQSAWKGDDRPARDTLLDAARRWPWFGLARGAATGVGLHAQARDLWRHAPALPAARAPAADHPGVFLLAGHPGAVAVLLAAGCLWPQNRFRLARKLSL